MVTDQLEHPRWKIYNRVRGELKIRERLGFLVRACDRYGKVPSSKSRAELRSLLVPFRVIAIVRSASRRSRVISRAALEDGSRSTSRIRQRVYHQKLTRASSDATAHVLIRGNPWSFNREQYLPFSRVLGPTFPIARETFRAAGAPKGAGLRRMSITVTSD